MPRWLITRRSGLWRLLFPDCRSCDRTKRSPHSMIGRPIFTPLFTFWSPRKSTRISLRRNRCRSAICRRNCWRGNCSPNNRMESSIQACGTRGAPALPAFGLLLCISRAGAKGMKFACRRWGMDTRPRPKSVLRRAGTGRGMHFRSIRQALVATAAFRGCLPFRGVLPNFIFE